MVARLSVVTALIALFAVSFAAVVEGSRPSHADIASAGCLDTGLVCAARR